MVIKRRIYVQKIKINNMCERQCQTIEDTKAYSKEKISIIQFAVSVKVTTNVVLSLFARVVRQIALPMYSEVE